MALRSRRTHCPNKGEYNFAGVVKTSVFVACEVAWGYCERQGDFRTWVRRSKRRPHACSAPQMVMKIGPAPCFVKPFSLRLRGWESGGSDCAHFRARLRHCPPGADFRRNLKDRVASLRDLRDPETGELLDRAIVLRFFAPRSFTGEEMAELQITGGRAVLKSVLAGPREDSRAAAR